MNHIELGQKGEELAVELLTNKDYKIMERNYRFGHSELDIIGLKDDTLVIVEVKTRNSSALGDPSNAVTRNKQRQIIKVANAYIQKNAINKDVRFDVVAIIHNQNYTKIDHIENAFYPIV